MCSEITTGAAVSAQPERFSRGDLERIIAAVFEVDLEGRAVVRGRIDQLKRAGVWSVEESGRGKRVDYSLRNVMEALMLLEGMALEINVTSLFKKENAVIEDIWERIIEWATDFWRRECPPGEAILLAYSNNAIDARKSRVKVVGFRETAFHAQIIAPDKSRLFDIDPLGRTLIEMRSRFLARVRRAAVIDLTESIRIARAALL